MRENGNNWRGGVIERNGAVYVYMPSHPKATRKNMHVKRADLVAEQALGTHLPPKAIVHHFDKDSTNDSNQNLVVCQDQAYHSLLHRRQRAYEACGHANWRKCRFCKEYDDPKNLWIGSNSNVHHITCHKEYWQNYKRKSSSDPDRRTRLYKCAVKAEDFT